VLVGCFDPSDVDPMSTSLGDGGTAEGSGTSGSGSDASASASASGSSTQTSTSVGTTIDPGESSTVADPDGGSSSEDTTTGEPQDTCANGALDGDETSVDCGGSCPPCGVGESCATNADCAMGECVTEVCLLACHPIQQNCADGEGCYPVDIGFFCVQDASAAMGAFGSECEYINACDPGLACILGELVPNCTTMGCCSPFCDVTDPNCPAPTTCLGFFEAGQAPPDLQDVGVCALPM